MAAYSVRRLAVVLFTSLLVWPSPAAGGRQAVLVTPDHAGGEGTARTIREGIAMVGPGGRVMVMPGVYEEEALRIEKGLTIEGVGGERGEVVLTVPKSPDTVDVAILVETTEPVAIRNLTLRHHDRNGIRSVRAADLTVERVTVRRLPVAPDDPLRGLGRMISLGNTETTGPRGRLVLRQSHIDGGIPPLQDVPANGFLQVFGVIVAGDVDALIEGNVIEGVGGACIAIFLRSDFGGETNAEIVGNELDRCYALQRAGAIITGPPGAPLPASPISATGVVSIVGNTIRNSNRACVPATGILFETFTGKIEHNEIVDFVQDCTSPSNRARPAAIAVGSIRGDHFPAVNAAVRFNDVAGNAQAGLRVAPTEDAALDATCNWWGSADGPSGDGPGSGDALVVEGDAATPSVAPWTTAPISGRPGYACSRGP